MKFLSVQMKFLSVHNESYSIHNEISLLYIILFMKKCFTCCPIKNTFDIKSHALAFVSSAVGTNFNTCSLFPNNVGTNSSILLLF